MAPLCPKPQTPRLPAQTQLAHISPQQTDAKLECVHTTSQDEKCLRNCSRLSRTCSICSIRFRRLEQIGTLEPLVSHISHSGLFIEAVATLLSSPITPLQLITLRNYGVTVTYDGCGKNSTLTLFNSFRLLSVHARPLPLPSRIPMTWSPWQRKLE